MRRGARVAESGGLENRCTLTGTVGSNPTLSVRDFKSRISNLKSEIDMERSPNWYGTALEARRAERPVRVRVPLSPLYDLKSQISNLRFECQAPDSVQSRTREPRQDRKVATVAQFGCAAVVTGACPIFGACFALIQYQYRARKWDNLTNCPTYARGSCAWLEIYSISPLYLAQRALAAAFSFLLVASETTRLGLALTEANALEGLPRRRTLAAATPGITFASCSRWAVNSLI